jgi:transcription antitermination factor NusG
MTNTEKTVLSNLLKEIKDKSLQNTLRKVLFEKESVVNAITMERPEMNNKDLLKLKVSCNGG